MAARIHVGPALAYAGKRRGVVHLVGQYRYDAPGVRGRIVYAEERTLCGRTLGITPVPADRITTCAACQREVRIRHLPIRPEEHLLMPDDKPVSATVDVIVRVVVHAPRSSALATAEIQIASTLSCATESVVGSRLVAIDGVQGAT